MHTKLVKLEQTFNSSVLTKIDDPLLDSYDIELWAKRDDLLHPVISGNKWRKLKFSLDHALSLGADTVISMGGTYSNHLHALAYAGKALGIKTIGIVRSEQAETLTPTLIDLQRFGMELKFVSRSEYRLLRCFKKWYELPDLKSRHYWLPEGGAQTLALSGVADMVSEINISYDTICVPCGTGTTMAGIINAVPNTVSVLGFAALKNAGFLNYDIESLIVSSCNNWRINMDYHFGGFAKVNAELMMFIKDFEETHEIPLEPVYTGKMFYGLYDMIKNQKFKPGQRIIAVHTGGLQGKRGFNQA